MLERILIPLDGSEVGEAVLPRIQPLLPSGEGDVLLLHVLHRGDPSDESRTLPLSEVREKMNDYLQSVRERLQKSGARARCLIEEGLHADTILRVAEREKTTLIAMSTHGESGSSSFRSGSVAEKVLRASPIPLFLLRFFLKLIPA